MNFLESLKKDLIEEIETSPFKDMKFRVLYLLRYQLISKFINNPKKVDDISTIIEIIFEAIIKKFVQNFGSISNIIRYCLTNFFEINEEFTTDELYKVIKENFYYYDKTKYSKYLINQVPKYIKSAKEKRKTYCVIKRDKKYFHI